MNLLDPFSLFCIVEFISLVALIAVWLRLDLNLAYVTLYGHITPELDVDKSVLSDDGLRDSVNLWKESHQTLAENHLAGHGK